MRVTVALVTNGGRRRHGDVGVEQNQRGPPMNAAVEEDHWPDCRERRLFGKGHHVAAIPPHPRSHLTAGLRVRTGAAWRRRCNRNATIEYMAIQRMEHVGIVVDDLTAAIEFFVELGLEPGDRGRVEGEWVDRIIALDGTKAELAMLRTPDGHGEIELVKFHSPPPQGGDPHAPSNTPGLRHLAFLVEDIDAVVAGLRARGTELVGELVRYENSYRLCYVRGPEGIIIELAEKIS